MSRQTRTLLLVGLLAVGGVSVLAFLANRYSAIQAADDEATAAAVVGFITTRQAVIAALDAEPVLKAELAEELSGKARRIPSRMHYKLLITTRVAREQALAGIGMSEEDYHRVRQSFIAWMGFKFAETPADPKLVKEFERRREDLEPLYLDLLETVDQ